MTLSDWYAMIEANPADWDQRLVFSDWLEQQGEDVLANGQRWQVEHEGHFGELISGNTSHHSLTMWQAESWLAHRLAELGIMATGVRA